MNIQYTVSIRNGQGAQNGHTFSTKKAARSYINSWQLRGVSVVVRRAIDAFSDMEDLAYKPIGWARMPRF